MTLNALILFAAVYFAAVATPGPGVAALVARVLGQGLKGVAPFIAGYFVGDMVWLALAATGLAVVARTFAGAVHRDQIRRRGLSALSGVADGDRARAAGRAPPPVSRGWRAFLGALSLTLGNPKVMIFFLSIMPLVVDVRALTVARAHRARRGLRGGHLLDSRRLCARRQPRASVPPFDPSDEARPSRSPAD